MYSRLGALKSVPFKERVNQLPEVDMQQVERLKQQVTGGVYQVRGEILAENILAASVDGSQDG